MDQGQIQIEARLPSGTKLEKTDEISRKIEGIVMEIPEVNSILTNMGSSSQMQMGGGTSSGSDIANFLIELVPGSERARSTSAVVEEIRNKINIPDVTTDVSSMDMIGGGLGGGKPVNIKVKGDSLNILERITGDITREITDIAGVREIEDSFSDGRPELQVQINRTLAAKQGLRVGQIGSIIESSISGQVSTRYEVGGEEYDIRVKLDEGDVNTPASVRNLTLISSRGNKVPLDSVADFKMEEGPRTIEREDQVRYATVNAALYETNLGTAMEKIRNKLDQNLSLPPGYEIEYGGQYEQMMSSFRDLFFAFLLAVVLVYMVMASQFESLLYPFVIMFTVPMAIIGVLLGLYITGHNISVISIIGVVMLAGIVVNNAIVLVDYINTVRGRGKSVTEAILEAGPIRLRPILMTAFTTILALLPIALGLGEGAEVQAPMGTVVIGGLSIATFLTLYVIPVLYSLTAGISKKIKPGN